MELLVLVFGGFFAFLFVLNNIFQTAKGSARLGRIGTFLAFVTMGISLWGLIENQATPGQLINRVIVGIAAAVILIGLLILIFEFRRSPRNLVQSRGILSIGIGILLLISIFTVPFLSAYFYVAPDAPAVSIVSSPTPQINITPTQAEASGLQEQFARFFRNIFEIVGETTGLDNQAMVKQLNQKDMTVAKLIQNNNGNLDTVVKEVVDLTRRQIQMLMSEGRVNRLQGALILSNLEFFIRMAINNPIEPDRLDDLSALLMATEVPAETEESTATPAPSLTATLTPTPVLTRTPRPSPTPTRTREHFATRTPTMTPTLPNPCLAMVDYNLNLRATPDFDAEVLVVIPYNSTITLFARSEDSTWWLTIYEGQEGWVSGEYIRPSDSCTELPVR